MDKTKIQDIKDNYTISYDSISKFNGELKGLLLISKVNNILEYNKKQTEKYKKITLNNKILYKNNFISNKTITKYLKEYFLYDIKSKYDKKTKTTKKIRTNIRLKDKYEDNNNIKLYNKKYISIYEEDIKRFKELKIKETELLIYKVIQNEIKLNSRIDINYLMKLFNLDKYKISKILNKLIKNNLIKLVINKEDKRKRDIKILENKND